MPKFKIYDEDGELHTADVDEGVDLIDAASEAGVDLPHSCGRGGWCSTCAVEVVKGKIGDPKSIYPAMGPEELEAMERAEIPPDSHVLSCSCQVFGPVTVRQPSPENIKDLTKE